MIRILIVDDHPVVRAGLRAVIESQDDFAASRTIGELPSPPRVMILTTYDADADVLSGLDAGAVGYLLKDAPPDVLFDAIRTAAAGETVLAPTVASRLVDRVRRPAQQALSWRELEVLEAVAEGLVNKAIARRLHLSEATVKTHLVHIFAKRDVDTRTAAVAAAVERGLIRLR